MKLKLALLVSSLIGTLLVCELALRLVKANSEDPVNNPAPLRATLYQAYSAAELDSQLGLFSPAQGSACLSLVADQKFPYHPYFGYNATQLDMPCAQKFFANSGQTLVYLGGSVMRNTNAPNYLTTIDTALQKELPAWRSLNLAESGARSTNELMRLIYEVVDLKPKAVIFLDGFNEFNSLRYGGRSSDDFYWTAGVEQRVRRPWAYFSEALLYKSSLAQLLLVQTKLVTTPFGPQAKPSPADIAAAAQLYVNNAAKIDKICQAYEIECLFFLQPYIFSKAKLSAEEALIAQTTEEHYPGIRQVLDLGYRSMRQAQAVKVHDLSLLFNDSTETAFFDVVHLNKYGNAQIAKAMAQVLARSKTATP